jgi:putative ABC transport system substrate-binding protein
MSDVRRRDVFAIAGGLLAARPFTVSAQPSGVWRRVGVLMSTANEPLGRDRVSIFVREMLRLGWDRDRNIHIDVRWGAGNADQFRKHAAELVSLAPDVLVAGSGAAMPALMQATRTIPIVFVLVPDPVGSGFVSSLARPGGNATGFMLFEFSLGAKWLEILKQVAPQVTRVAVLRDPGDPAGIGQFGAIQGSAPSFGVEVHAVDVRDVGEIERGMANIAREPNAGVVVTGSAPAGLNRKAIIAAAERHRLPAVYAYSYFPADGGLISYGPDVSEPFRRAPAYIDRILKGEKAAELPVQAPVKYEMVINLRTAKAMGLSLPPLLLARADEVIE